MVQWINVHWFVNLMQLPLLCEITGAVALTQLGLMAGRQAGSQIKCS